MAKKRYADVATMIEELSGDQQFTEAFNEYTAGRRLIKSLVMLRSAMGVSQADVAKVLGVTQSRISKIEHGVDDNLRLGELAAYARALDMDIAVVLKKRSRTIVNGGEFHVDARRRAPSDRCGRARLSLHLQHEIGEPPSVLTFNR